MIVFCHPLPNNTIHLHLSATNRCRLYSNQPILKQKSNAFARLFVLMENFIELYLNMVITVKIKGNV